MQEKPTDELNSILENTHPDQLSDFLKENSRFMADDKKGFYYYFKDVLDKKNIKLKDVYSFAGVSESYGSKILAMEKHTKSRDLIIRLCIAGHFSWDETNRALKLYGMTELYAKDPRDACLIVAINNRKYDLADIDDLLEQQGMKKLTVDE
jgi:hypothetical protein